VIVPQSYVVSAFRRTSSGPAKAGHYVRAASVYLPITFNVTRSVDGQTVEEWTFKTVKVNPTFKPDTFSKR